MIADTKIDHLKRGNLQIIVYPEKQDSQPIQSMQIGSDLSTPRLLSVGIDEFLEKVQYAESGYEDYDDVRYKLYTDGFTVKVSLSNSMILLSYHRRSIHLYYCGNSLVLTQSALEQIREGCKLGKA